LQPLVQRPPSARTPLMCNGAKRRLPNRRRHHDRPRLEPRRMRCVPRIDEPIDHEPRTPARCRLRMREPRARLTLREPPLRSQTDAGAHETSRRSASVHQACKSRRDNMPRRLRAVLAAAALLASAMAWAEVDYKIVTASERGTYIQVGRDLARFVAPQADISLEVLPSAGSAENVRRLRFEPGV